MHFEGVSMSYEGILKDTRYLSESYFSDCYNDIRFRKINRDK